MGSQAVFLVPKWRGTLTTTYESDHFGADVRARYVDGGGYAPSTVLANQGDTLAEYLHQIPAPRFMPDEDNVIPLLDGEWFADDVTERFRTFLRVTFGEEHYEEIRKKRQITMEFGGEE